MKELRHSRQRDAILENLRGRYDHPTADVIYADIKKDFPKISLGTVYRNLALLTEIGEIRKLDCGQGIVRYDGHTECHDHFVCSRCGKTIDLAPSKNVIAAKNSAIGSIESYSLIFKGYCKECKKIMKIKEK